jgi:hypothetical protein
MKQTAVEWLIEQLEERGHIIPDHIEETSLIMEKQQIIDAHISGYDSSGESAKDYYDFYYGSKGSDEIVISNKDKIFSEEDMRKAIQMSKDIKYVTYSDDNIIDSITQSKETSSQTEISDEKPMRFHCVPKEISDEEIEKYAKQNAFQYYEFITGAKWYREQLKSM